MGPTSPHIANGSISRPARTTAISERNGRIGDFHLRVKQKPVNHRMLTPSAALHRLHVFRHDLLSLLEVVRGAEEHDLRAGLVLHRDVAGRSEEGAPRLEDLLDIRVAERHPPADDVAPMRTLAP